MPGSTARQQRKAPPRLTSSTSSQSRRGSWRGATRGGCRALLTSPSSGPSDFSISRTSRPGASRSRRSSAKARARPAGAASTARAAPSSLRKVKATVAPSATSASTTARPMPRLPPVTSTRAPLMHGRPKRARITAAPMRRLSTQRPIVAGRAAVGEAEPDRHGGDAQPAPDRAHHHRALGFEARLRESRCARSARARRSGSRSARRRPAGPPPSEIARDDRRLLQRRSALISREQVVARAEHEVGVAARPRAAAGSPRAGAGRRRRA